MNYFEDVELFSDLSPEDQSSLSDFCQTQTLNAGDTLFKQWDEPQAMYIIASGKMLVQKELTWWEKKDVALLWEGDLVWEIAFFWEPPTRNATLIAHESSKLIVIIRFGIQQMIEKYPELYQKVKNIIQERSA